MNRFDNEMAIVVTNKESPLFGKHGQVKRLLMRDCSAWVRMNEDIPSELQLFSDERKNDVNLWPDECEKA